MDPDKAPSPNGFSTKLFQCCWEIVGEDVVKVIQKFQQNNSLLKSWNITFLALIPKV